MERFWRYLEDEPKTILAGIISFLYWFALCIAYEKLVFYQGIGYVLVRMVPIKIALLLAYGALSEEAAYRAMPLIICLEIKKLRKRTVIFLSWVVFSGFIFGLAHYFGLANFPLWKAILGQGVGGLILGLVYMKFGGLMGKTGKPFLICSLFHWLYNIVTYCFIII